MKRGQIDISYGMIFSVILIGVFLFVGFFAIKMFLDLGEKAEVAGFINELREEINTLYRSVGGAEGVVVTLNTNGKLTHVCFFDRTKEITGDAETRQIGEDLRRIGGSLSHNMYFYPRNSVDTQSTEIENIDMDKLESNPYCIKKEDDKIKITLSKDISETLVRIS